MLIKLLILYLLIINAAGLLLMLVDKIKAKKNLWRIPEVMFFVIAAIGGSIGSLAGMYLCRHKTKHFHFILGMFWGGCGGLFFKKAPHARLTDKPQFVGTVSLFQSQINQ
jgi:uncharacterized membrane protein YsdA (DUF1294 family)